MEAALTSVRHLHYPPEVVRLTHNITEALLVCSPGDSDSFNSYNVGSKYSWFIIWIDCVYL